VDRGRSDHAPIRTARIGGTRPGGPEVLCKDPSAMAPKPVRQQARGTRLRAVEVSGRGEPRWAHPSFAHPFESELVAGRQKRAVHLGRRGLPEPFLLSMLAGTKNERPCWTRPRSGETPYKTQCPTQGRRSPLNARRPRMTPGSHRDSATRPLRSAPRERRGTDGTKPSRPSSEGSRRGARGRKPHRHA